MLWKGRDATERIFINFKQELQKKHVFREEGCFRDDFLQRLNEKQHALEGIDKCTKMYIVVMLGPLPLPYECILCEYYVKTM